MSNGFGQTGGFLTVGEVINVKDDPTQTGRVKVRWHVGAVSQNQLQESDLPWTQCMFPTTNPSNNNTGGPHHGLQVGSKVYGVPIDGHGQDFIIVGSVPRAGNGAIDQQANYNADTPHPGKVQTNNGQTQPTFGDKNSVVSQDSIWLHGQQQGGKANTSTLYHALTDSIGLLASITESPMGQGAAGGVDALLSKLQSVGNIGGSFPAGVGLLQNLKAKIEGVPFQLLQPGMSNVISSGNMISGLMNVISGGGLSSLANFAGLGGIGQIVSQISSLASGNANLTPSQLAQLAASTISGTNLASQLGPLNAFSTSLLGM